MPNTDEYLPSAEIPVMANGCKLNNPVALRFLNCACVFVLQEQLSSVEEEWKVTERVKEPGLTAVVRKYADELIVLFFISHILRYPQQIF